MTATRGRSSRSSRRLLILCAAAVALTVAVVVLGAFTRLVDAGLGCPDWPGCYGHLTWPSSEEQIARAEARFPDAPVELDKTWPEMVHRYFASALGLMILVIAGFALAARRKGETVPVKLPLFLVGLVMLQGAFGAWTVTLKLWPQVVTAHLLGGFATLSLLWLLLQRTAGWRWSASGPARRNLLRMRPWALIVLVLVVLQIALGGWTSANYAALACPDLPTCHGDWWPDMDFAKGFDIAQHVGPNYLGGLLENEARTAIHVSHRLGAIVVTLALLALAFQLWRSQHFQARRMALVILCTTGLQVALGLSNVAFFLPLSVAVAHNAGGALLLLVLVTLNHRLRTLRSHSETVL